MTRKIRVPAALPALALLAFALSGCSTISGSDFRHIRGHDTNLAAINTQLGIAYMGDNKPDLAMRALRKALQKDPDLVLAHDAIAVLYERLGEFNKADRHFRRALDLDPKNSNAQNNYGAFLCRRGRIKEAEAHFRAALDNPLYAHPEQAWSNWGFCAVKAGDNAKAEIYLRRALHRNPKFAPALLEMARLGYRRKRWRQARAYLERYRAVAPNTPGGLWLAIRIERQLGNRNAAASDALLLKSKYPDSAQARQLLESESNGRASGQ